MKLNSTQQQQLRNVARRAIEHGLQHGQPLIPPHKDCASELLTQTASFVTLKRHGELRGCIGTLLPVRPLIDDVAHNAFAAAFRDARFAPLQENELDQLMIHLSVLGKPETLAFNSEQQLIAQLHPGVDGVILSEGSLRATFLPSVWETLPDPQAFLRQLKQKAGLPAHYWSDTMEFQRYAVDSF